MLLHLLALVGLLSLISDRLSSGIHPGLLSFHCCFCTLADPLSQGGVLEAFLGYLALHLGKRTASDSFQQAEVISNPLYCL